jgi:hypothetical protein
MQAVTPSDAAAQQVRLRALFAPDASAAQRFIEFFTANMTAMTCPTMSQSNSMRIAASSTLTEGADSPVWRLSL